MLEQMRLADIFVHYNDVQFSKGHFQNRIKIKTSKGAKWMTIPLRAVRLGQSINEICIDETSDWRGQHIELLYQAYREAPYRDEMLAVVNRTLQVPAKSLADVTRTSMEELAKYFELLNNKQFINVENLDITGSSSQRVCDILVKLKGKRYVTGWGALQYLNHDLFSKLSIKVEYMDYKFNAYPQLHGEFTPFVSSLDLIANCGKKGISMINSNSISWQEFIKRRKN